MSGSIRKTKPSPTSSRSANPASREVPAEPPNDSVFDFLYQDARRVGSLLAQFDDSGHLQQIIHGDTSAKAKRAAYKVEMTAGLGEALGLPGGGVSLERNPAESGSMSSERTYDPLWSNARAILDYLTAADLIEKDATKAAIGQIVLVTGKLYVVDTAILKVLTEGQNFKKQMRGGAGGKGHKGQTSTTDADMGIELFQSMPTTIQARLSTETNHSFWGGLLPEGLTATPGEIMMKHGFELAGGWSVLGILDALPETPVSGLDLEVENALSVVTLGALVGGLAVLVKTLRPMMGRPNDAYGVTPLLIFREIAARK